MISVLSLTVLISCKSELRQRSVDESGYCTHSFIDGYNNIRSKRRALAKLPRESSPLTKARAVFALDDSCSAFYTEHSAGVLCVAEVDDEEVAISGYDHQEFCTRISEAIKTSKI